MKVIPHDKLEEGENAQKSRFDHVPARLFHHCPPHGRIDFAQINAVIVLGQGIQSADAHGKILLKHFQQGDIHLRLFVP